LLFVLHQKNAVLLQSKTTKTKTSVSVSPGKENLALFIFPSNKIIVIILYAFWKLCVTVWRASCEVWTQLRSIQVLHRLSVSPPPTCSPVWYEKRPIYAEFWGTIPQYTVLLSLCLVTIWFSTHHHHHWQDPSSSSSPEKQ
jgi:hypothetical protein